MLRLPSTATSWLRGVAAVVVAARRPGPARPGRRSRRQADRRSAALLPGAVELVLTDGMLDVRSERCDSGDGCPIRVPVGGRQRARRFTVSWVESTSKSGLE